LAEVHGDPHFLGFLDQDYTISGKPFAVYNIISCPSVLYDARFIQYQQEVYHGMDPVHNRSYDANVTYVGDVGLRLINTANPQALSEDRLFFFMYNRSEPLVLLNGELLPVNRMVRFGMGWSVLVTKRTIQLEHDVFTWHFSRGGGKNKYFFNQKVDVNDWGELSSCHGLLGQTWMDTPLTSVIRDELDLAHEDMHGTEFMFRNAEFLEGHLYDYEIKQPSTLTSERDELFGDEFRFNKFVPIDERK